MPDDDLPDADFEELLVFLRESRGVDFTGYKRTSLRRLVARRMRTAGADDVRDYLDRLEVDPAEVIALFDSLLINVTAFFRDPATWEALRDELLPAAARQARPGRAGPRLERRLRQRRGGLLAGDPAARAARRRGVQGPGEGLRDRRRRRRAGHRARGPLLRGRPRAADRRPAGDVLRADDDGGHLFRPDLRPNIIFGRHDLLADAPISRVQLLTCRNVLMYFTAETQARILERFAFALHEHGLLVLGRAEMLLTHSEHVHGGRPAAPHLLEHAPGAGRPRRSASDRRRWPARR